MSIISIIADLTKFSGGSSTIKELVPLIVFSGESNSGGQALNSQATANEIAVRPETKILNNTTLLFEDLDIGTNNMIGHANMSTPTLRHGWELNISNLAANNQFINNPIHIVKTGQGGTIIDNWNIGATYSGINPWQLFQDRVDAALSILNPIGTKFVLFYSQGINDGIAGTNVSTWKTKTIEHFNKIRLKYGNIPIVITKLMVTAPSYSSFNTAIEEICVELPNCYFVDVTGLGQDDTYHWSYLGMKTLATKMLNKTLENYKL